MVSGPSLHTYVSSPTRIFPTAAAAARCLGDYLPIPLLLHSDRRRPGLQPSRALLLRADDCPQPQTIRKIHTPPRRTTTRAAFSEQGLREPASLAPSRRGKARPTAVM